jgi:hypothetical protein
MTPAEAGVLLAGISHFDNRKPGTPEEADRTATLWAQALHDVSLPDAGQAVTQHFATSTEYLMPAHIRAAVKRIRAKRLEDHPPLTPPPGLPGESDADLVTRQLAWLKDARRRVADGEHVDCDQAYGELKPRVLSDLKQLMPAPTEEAG